MLNSLGFPQTEIKIKNKGECRAMKKCKKV